MRPDIERTVGFHRRLKGVGRSEPNDPTGVFDIKWRACKWAGERRAVCDLSFKDDVYKLHIVVHERKEQRSWPRAPSWQELERIMPLFFYPDRYPVQFFECEDRTKNGISFYYFNGIDKIAKKIQSIL
jgi:hypothetical protein